MAELTGPIERGRAPRAGRLDIRLKLILLAAGSLVVLRLGLPALVLMFFLVSAGLAAFRCLPPFRGAERRWLFVLLAFVFVARALSTPGAAWLSAGPFAISGEGLREASQATLRLALVFLLGAAFVFTTRTPEIKAGVQWFLKPLPGVPAGRVGAMLGLVIRFIPMILEQAAATAEAQRARGVENRRSPVYRAARFGFPLMRRVFLSADTLALAMESRCYADERTDPALAFRASDWLFFIPACAVLAAFGIAG